ncbi:MAG: hydroxymethylbilane synthase [Anaeromicrobium sp.]|jgi:hydroxymethylbilane synthase|uniref:hydroxymethylbilane synthase n=1 Tax=Anaeromicrobium sp. TaxID=1929132 RepID=UPI0025FDF198|nr:hydroxymethylbilane synthase [Anaeromicrobium sp.]MCT4593253.1 hydroxymethylbilane synthase [Anaeromicrobium sp.]
MDKIIKVGSRCSELALKQTHIVIGILKEHFPEYEYEIVEIKTIGDKILDKTLDKIGGKGLFVKEIESALLNKEIDLAVHSMKDVPTVMVEGLKIGAITKREDVRDVFIGKNNLKIEELKSGAKVGTSSLRRKAQLLAYRNDLDIVPIRGNIRTRIGKIDEMDLDGIILAAAGIHRMDWNEKINGYINENICTPAVGQGALGIQIREKDPLMDKIIGVLNHGETEYAIKAERSFMRVLEGGCHVPMGAFCEIKDNMLNMIAVVASLDGKEVIRLERRANLEEYTKLGEDLAKEALDKGARHILDKIEGND